MKNQKRVTDASISKLKDKGVNVDGTTVVGVPAAAKFLGVSERRVRTFLSPECRCIIRKRRAELKPRPDPDCPYCGGDGRARPRIPSMKMQDRKYLIKVDDLVEFAREQRPGGRPKEG